MPWDRIPILSSVRQDISPPRGCTRRAGPVQWVSPTCWTSRMNLQSSPAIVEAPTRVRYGVLGFACSLSMITYLDRVCFGSVAGYIQHEFGLDEAQKGWLF